MRGAKGAPEVNTLPARPSGANREHEYSMLRENSEDYISLRRTLVMSPIFTKIPFETQNSLDSDPEVNFRGSIFQQILTDRPSNSSNNNGFLGIIKESLIQGEDKNELNDQLDNSRPIAPSRSRSEDSWDRFNSLLLRYLNSYMHQVKTASFEYDLARVAAHDINIEAKLKQSRRSSRGGVGLDEAAKQSSDHETVSANTGSSNLLTFACLARDGNPVGNLSFDWMFGSSSLPEAEEFESPLLPTDKRTTSGRAGVTGSQRRTTTKPVLLYSNVNSSLSVILVHRLDTKLNLNPFQLSLLTISVVIEPTSRFTTSDRIERQASLNKSITHSFGRAPVIKNRFQASLEPIKPAHSGGNFDNIQFANDFEMKAYNSFPSTPTALPIELSESNWQEQIGNLLKCSITNQIGSSDLCHARVNIAQRLRSKANESSEFAKWRMPSLSNKSLLIISILLGCTLVVFATSALLFGPHLKSLNFKKDSNEGASEGTSTGQSTSSQKSSVLGLLGTGDSLPTSSDDDGSARLNSQVVNTRGIDLGSMTASEQLLSKQMNDMKQTIHQHQSGTSGYDRPRYGPSRDSHSTFEEGAFNEATTDRYLSCVSDRYNRFMTNQQLSARTCQSNRSSLEAKGSFSSAGSRLLANLGLKSFSKFKVDRISDLSNFSSRADQMRSLHAKTISNTETSTTGLSGSVMDSDQSLKLTSPAPSNSPVFFAGPRESRHSYTGFKRSDYLNQTLNRSTIVDKCYSDRSANGPFDTKLGSYHNSELSFAPTYSNLPVNHVRDAMEEFIKRRDPEYHLNCQQNQINSSAFIRSQSTKIQSYAQNDLSVQYPNQLRVKPPIYPRAHQLSTFYKPIVDDFILPATFARVPHQVSKDIDCHYNHPIPNRFSVHNIGPAYHANQLLMPSASSYSTSVSSSATQHQQHLGSYAPVSVSLGAYTDQNTHETYASTLNPQPGLPVTGRQQVLVEHIYDVNAYATPNQTPLRTNPNKGTNQQNDNSETSERPRVSQLIHSFNTQLPNNSGFSES